MVVFNANTDFETNFSMRHNIPILLDELQKQGEMFGLPSKNCHPHEWLNEGDVIKIGNEVLEIFFCPGPRTEKNL